MTSATPTLEQRIATLEAHVQRMRDDYLAADEKLRTQMEHRIEATRSQITNTAKHEVGELAKFTTGAMSGQKWPTIGGAIAITLGLVISLIGSLMLL